MKTLVFLMLLSSITITSFAAGKVVCSEPAESNQIIEKLKEFYAQLRIDELRADLKQSENVASKAFEVYDACIKESSDFTASILGVNNICRGEKMRYESSVDRSDTIGKTIDRQFKLLEYKRISLIRASASCRFLD